jgi:multimeric flavodoxin WrbA
MKILAICGSPRKGNTYSALNTIRENFPEIDFEILMLKDLNFQLCKGCYACVLRGEEKCPIKDDRDMIIQKIEAADGLIAASPVYSHMVPAIMKNLFDRFGFYAHRPEFFDKFAMSIVTCSGYGGEHAIRYMDKGLGVYGFNLAPSLELHYQPGKIPEKQMNEIKEKIIDGFTVFLNRIQKGTKDKPTLNMIVPFGIFKAISEVAKDDMPADYEYYKDKKDFYYDVKLPFFKKWIAKKVVKKEFEKIMN